MWLGWKRQLGAGITQVGEIKWATFGHSLAATKTMEA